VGIDGRDRMVGGVKPQPQSNKWKLYPVVAYSILAGLLYFDYWFYLQDGIAQIEYGLRHNADFTLGMVWGRILFLPIAATIAAAIHNLFVK